MLKQHYKFINRLTDYISFRLRSFYDFEVRESHSLFVHIYIFCIVVHRFIFVLLHTILNSSFQPLDKRLTGTITPGQSGPGSDSNEGVYASIGMEKTKEKQRKAGN